jgi:beta-lactamase class D
MFRWLALLTIAVGCVCHAAPSTAPDLGSLFGSFEGCCVLYDSQTREYVRRNPKECAERFSPCSTFKIPHTLIALEAGVATGPEFALPWDGVKRGLSAWDQDQTLRSAFQNSVVWFYQELARRIGIAREEQFVRKLSYGNMDLSGGLTNFWLESSLSISADEQVAFLRRLWAGELPVSQSAQSTTRKLMEISRSPGRVFYGKTGTGGSRELDVARLGWFVGCVERENRNVFVAVRITGEKNASGREARKIVEAILTAWKI